MNTPLFHLPPAPSTRVYASPGTAHGAASNAANCINIGSAIAAVTVSRSAFAIANHLIK